MCEEDERPAGGNAALRCPLFLLTEETAEELEPLLRDLRGSGYTLLSMRELFRCRRGLRRWPPRPCGILLRGFSFSALRGLLPCIARWEAPVNLFCSVPYGDEEAETLRGYRFLAVYADAGASAPLSSLLPEGADRHVAAFCDPPDGRAAAFLRENRIWMAITVADAGMNAPQGTEVLYALPAERGIRLLELLARWHRRWAQETAFPSVIPAREAVFDPSDGSYRLLPAEAIPDGVCRGWEASVAFANWVFACKRRETPAFRSSVRTFLEERQLSALQMQALYEREKLNAEEIDAYRRLLGTVLRELDGRPSPSRIGRLLRRLLSAEELCRRTLEADAALLEKLRAFKKEKRTRKA